MSLPKLLEGRLRLPVIGSPLFIISIPALVIAQCKAGIVGSFPALNARPLSQLDEWLHEITEALAAHDRAHPEQPRRALRGQPDRAQVERAARAGSRAHRQMEGADRHHVAGRARGRQPARSIPMAASRCTTSSTTASRTRRSRRAPTGSSRSRPAPAGTPGRSRPSRWSQEIREWFDGPLALSGAIATGGAVLAAQAMGADLAYIGSAFIATEEARATDAYKQAIVEGDAADIVGSSLFTGVFGNYLQALDRHRRPRSRQPAARAM